MLPFLPFAVKVLGLGGLIFAKVCTDAVVYYNAPRNLDKKMTKIS